MEAEIEVQIEGEDVSTVQELCLDKWRGSEISPQEKVILERFKSLNFLSFVGCGLKALVNFPNLPCLLRLDLSDNLIKGGLEHIPRNDELMEITLAGNPIAAPETLRPLTSFTTLMSLDLFECPINQVPNYKEKIFEMFPNLHILDGLDADGEEAYLDDSCEEDGLSEDSEALEALLNGEGDSEDEDYESEIEELDARRQKRPRDSTQDPSLNKHKK